MANTDTPLGFRLHNYPGGAEANITSQVVVNAATVAPGDPVELSSGQVQACSAATDICTGVAVGYQVGVTATAAEVLVIDNAEDCYFVVQSNGATAKSDIGKFGQCLVASPTQNRSRFELAHSTLEARGTATAGAQWRVVDILREENNTAGEANVKVIVQLDRSNV